MSQSTAELQVIRVVGAAIRNAQGEYLVAQRGEHMSTPGKWEFPGGKLERNESPEEALAREIKEELNLTIQVNRWIGVGMAKVSPRKQVRLDVYEATILSGELKLHEHQQAKWLEPSAFQALDWAQADLPIVERMMQTK